MSGGEESKAEGYERADALRLCRMGIAWPLLNARKCEERKRSVHFVEFPL